MARAVRTDRRSNSPTPAQSPRPRAWAVSPLVPMRRKPKSQYITLNIIVPTAMAAM